MTELPISFSDDLPLTSGEQDRLNRAPFAKRVAAVLLASPKGTGLVIGLHGPWGDGKTTVLNLIRAELGASKDAIVVEFNPWRFTDESAMLTGFFAVLGRTIGEKLTSKRKEMARWIESIARYASVIDARFAKAAEIAAAKAAVKLDELRERLVTVLLKADRRVVILIDDIDRLDRQETHTLFRLIKACANFPNVSYVLAFDDIAVAKALGDRYGSGDEASGRAFLEKIIQIPLKLPVAAKEDLRALCFEQVEKALAAAGISLTESQVGEFIKGFDHGASVRLTTPRAAKRYGNGLMFAMPMLKGETNAADLLLVEALRAFFPEVYSIIRDNHSAFSGVEGERFSRTDKEPRFVKLLEPVIGEMPPDEATAVKSLLVDLFPRLSGTYGFGNYGADWVPRWSREKRISSPDYCPRYFSYAIPRNDVPDAAIDELIIAAKAQDDASVTTWFETHLVGAKCRRIIEKLRSFEDTADPAAAEVLATALAKEGGRFPNPPALFDFAEPPSQAAILIAALLQRIGDRDRRVTVAKRVVEAAQPLWFGGVCVRWMFVTDKPEKQDANALTQQEVEDVRRVLVERIKARAAEGAPLFDPDVPQEDSLLYEWWRAEGRDPVQAHLLSVFAKDSKQVSVFLRSQAPLSQGMLDAIPQPGDIDANQIKGIKLLIDLDELACLIRKNCPGDFDNPRHLHDHDVSVERRLAEQFMFVYNKWKKDGEPPDAQVNDAMDGADPGDDDGRNAPEHHV